jgi:hypothetical protein
MMWITHQRKQISLLNAKGINGLGSLPDLGTTFMGSIPRQRRTFSVLVIFSWIGSWGQCYDFKIVLLKSWGNYWQFCAETQQLMRKNNHNIAFE